MKQLKFDEMKIINARVNNMSTTNIVAAATAAAVIPLTTKHKKRRNFNHNIHVSR